MHQIKLHVSGDYYEVLGQWVSVEELAEAAKEGLSRQAYEDSMVLGTMFFDDRIFNSHAIVFGCPDGTGDALDRSNFRTVLAELEGYGTTEDEVLECEYPIVFDGRIGGFGGTKIICCQVYTDETRSEYTDAFVAAVAAAKALRDYPIFDDSDYSELEWEEFEEEVDEAVKGVESDFEEDTDTDRQAIYKVLMWTSELRDQLAEEFPTVSWERAGEVYRQARNTYFTAKAEAEGYAQLNGQGALL